MKVLCIGDPHIQEKHIERSREMAKAIINLVEERMPDLVVILGDTLHSFERVNTTALDLAIEMIYEISDITTTALLIGNHDYPRPEVFMDAVHPFSALRRSQIILGEKVVNKKFGNIQLTFVPYVTTGLFKEALDTNPEWENSSVIFAHQEFKGCRMGAITSDNGDDWSQGPVQVVSGHIHDYQVLERVLYVGSPISHTFGESSRKTVSMITIEEGKPIQEERISLDVKDMRLDRVKASNLINYQIPEEAILKVIVTGTISENNMAKKLPIVKELNSLGHKVVFKDMKEREKDKYEPRNSYKYGNMLKEEVKDKPHLNKIYNSIFKQ